MFRYIYTDHVDFASCSHACEVYLAATKYMLPFLEQYCIKYLRENVNASSACELFELATFHDNSDIKDLKDVCIKVMYIILINRHLLFSHLRRYLWREIIVYE